jgi:HSP20 family molecular chaperone IbpA
MRFQALADPRFLTPLRALRQLERLLGEPDQGRPTPLSFALYTRGDDVLLCTALPGVEAKDISLEVKDDLLTVSGRFASEPESESALAEHVERPRGNFRRSLRLPFEIDEARVQARLERGVLEIELPRRVKNPPVKIQVRSEAPESQVQEN